MSPLTLSSQNTYEAKLSAFHLIPNWGDPVVIKLPTHRVPNHHSISPLFMKHSHPPCPNFHSRTFNSKPKPSQLRSFTHSLTHSSLENSVVTIITYLHGHDAELRAEKGPTIWGLVPSRSCSKREAWWSEELWEDKILRSHVCKSDGRLTRACREGEEGGGGGKGGEGRCACVCNRKSSELAKLNEL